MCFRDRESDREKKGEGKAFILLALQHELHFSDDWISKRLKNYYEFQLDYANCKYSISTLGEKKWSLLGPGSFRNVRTPEVRSYLVDFFSSVCQTY